MRVFLVIALLIISVLAVYYLMPSSKMSRHNSATFIAGSLTGNKTGENYVRSMHIYLPPGYDTSDQKYPCIYYLHGFTTDHNEYINLKMSELFDEAIEEGKIRQFILVVPDSYNKFKGSFYTNSEEGGKWADYIASDVVNYIDENYRTIQDRNSRGICGHSMGGNGALKISMLYPDIFGSVYALSPSVLGWSAEFNTDNPSFEIISKAKKEEDIFSDFYASVFMAMGRTYSCNLSKKPFMADMPVNYVNGNKTIDSVVLKKWEKEFPLMMIDTHLEALRSLNGIGIEWGLKDEFAHIPVSGKLFCGKLEKSGIGFEKSEFEGNHYGMIGGKDGRIYNQMLPFFSKHLRFN